MTYQIWALAAATACVAAMIYAAWQERRVQKRVDELRCALDQRGSIEDFVHALTHEVKSPLAAILGAVELLKEEMPPEHRAKFLENIALEASRVWRIVEKLLLLSSLEARKELEQPETIALLELLKESASSFEHLAERKAIRLELSGDEQAVMRGDRFFVRQAVDNLLQNALEFSPNGGRVRAVVQRHGGFVELSVYDNGPGIPEYARPRIFEKFYSLQRPDTGRKSSGLGLALVRNVAQLHGGRVEIKNSAGSGAVAILVFPKLES